MTEQTRRVVIKMRAAAADTIPETRLSELPLDDYFDPSVLPALERTSGAEVPALQRYRSVEVDNLAAALDLAGELRADPRVETAYVEAGPTPPPVVAVDDPRNAAQRYQDAAPVGIDARWAWEHSITGLGVGFVDLEQGWTLNHEDLAAANIVLISGVNRAFHGHGTAVLGEIGAVDNTLGGVGIAPGATVRVVSQWRTATRFGTAEAILSAVNAMATGGVLLLEAQTTYSTTGTTYLPVEVEEAAFDAIRHACDEGIIVVEAAGNGGSDLDTFSDVDGREVLNRSSADFRDSGAIMVGAASSAVPHTRMDFSNHGSRVDCFGWGENIDTTGDGFFGEDIDEYTSSFAGTSGASPIVAGAAVLVQSSLRLPATSEGMRSLLTTPGWHTESAQPARDRIGVMPNVRRTIEETRHNPLDLPLQRALERVLFGIINDAPGVVIGPDGPRPVDPGWGALWAIVAPEIRAQALATFVQKVRTVGEIP